MPYLNSCGVLRYQTVEAYDKFIEEVIGPEAGRQMLRELFGDPPPHRRFSEWPQITRCTHHESSYILAASFVGQTIELRFNPSLKDDGFYSIVTTHPPDRESGYIQHVIIPTENDPATFELNQTFAKRFIVVTASNNPHYTRKVWLIGINTCDEASDNE